MYLVKVGRELFTNKSEESFNGCSSDRGRFSIPDVCGVRQRGRPNSWPTGPPSTSRRDSGHRLSVSRQGNRERHGLLGFHGWHEMGMVRRAWGTRFPGRTGFRVRTWLGMSWRSAARSRDLGRRNTRSTGTAGRSLKSSRSPPSMCPARTTIRSGVASGSSAGQGRTRMRKNPAGSGRVGQVDR
jgi:hypothetical protein